MTRREIRDGNGSPSRHRHRHTALLNNCQCRRREIMKEPVRPDENTELPRTRRLSFISRYDSRCSGRDAFNLRREESKKVYILKRILSGEK